MTPAEKQTLRDIARYHRRESQYWRATSAESKGPADTRECIDLAMRHQKWAAAINLLTLKK